MADSQDSVTDKQPTNTKSLTYRLVQLGDGAFDLMQNPQTITFKSKEHQRRFMENLKNGNGGIDLVATDQEAKND